MIMGKNFHRSSSRPFDLLLGGPGAQNKSKFNSSLKTTCYSHEACASDDGGCFAELECSPSFGL